MKTLCNTLLNSNFQFPEDIKVVRDLHALPERVIQFGEGNFLRAFADWMFHLLNKQNLFNGRVVLVQSIKEGLADKINEQDGLYTLLLRGLCDGKLLEEKEIISSVSRCINPYTQWDAYLDCAKDPLIEYVISNTTEAGIVFEQEDRPKDQPPKSFPAKLTAYLFQRFTHFRGDPLKGMVIIPCELIERNGSKLRETVLQYAELWQLPQAFRSWVDTNNYFLNTLVDRVVPGYPKEETKKLTDAFGYVDQLIDTAELFHLWVIEGPKEIADRLPFCKIGLNVLWTNDLTPYRTRKVRILNGAHTATVPAAFLSGLETVGEMMDDEMMGKFVRQTIYQEIVPSIPLEQKMLLSFADSVIERFQNPFIKHYLLSILLNSSSKFRTRVLPSIVDYYHKNGKLPVKLTFALAAFVAIYKDGNIEGSRIRVQKAGGGDFTVQDDLWVLEFFQSVWKNYDGSKQAALDIAKAVLQNSRLWHQDLSFMENLHDAVGEYLYQITKVGMKEAVASLL